MEEHLQDVRQKLNKKATFEQALLDLQQLLIQNPELSVNSDFSASVQRSFTLLKSRYTAPAFWSAGRKLYQAVKEATGQSDLTAKCSEYIDECCAHLGEGPSTSNEAPQPELAGTQQGSREPYLFEGQFSNGNEAPPRQRGPEELLMEMLSAQMLAARSAGEGQEGQTVQPNEAMQADQTLPSMDPLEEELAMALAASLAAGEEFEGSRPGVAPPASKRAVRALVKEELTEQRLKQLGGPDAQCSVCREDLRVGDEVQIMPCSDSHVFHPPCLAPWLQEHNSCPVCRHELPTDDDRYERRKEREACEAIERKGAANAVAHNEFIYV